VDCLALALGLALLLQIELSLAFSLLLRRLDLALALNLLLRGSLLLLCLDLAFLRLVPTAVVPHGPGVDRRFDRAIQRSQLTGCGGGRVGLATTAARRRCPCIHCAALFTDDAHLLCVSSSRPRHGFDGVGSRRAPGIFLQLLFAHGKRRSAGGGALRAKTRRSNASRDGRAAAALPVPITLRTLGAIGAMRVISPVVTALRSSRIAAGRTGCALTNTVLGPL